MRIPVSEPTTFSEDEARGLAAGLQQTEWLDRRKPAFAGMLLLAPLAGMFLNVLSLLIPNVWYRMTLFYLALIPAAVIILPLGWRELLAPRVKHLAAGITAAIILYVLAGGVFLALAAGFPALESQTAALYAWKDQLPMALAISLLVFIIVPGEEIVWRGAATLPMAARWGPWRGCLAGALAFSAAHLAFGSALLLLAAAGAGFFWGLLTVKSRSLITALVCHLLWDLTVLFWLPY
jgi:membrane protease YdiL (CAAX protease family)